MFAGAFGQSDLQLLAHGGAGLVDELLGLGGVHPAAGDDLGRPHHLPPSQVDAALTYAKGKAYFAKKDYGDATQNGATADLYSCNGSAA